MPRTTPRRGRRLAARLLPVLLVGALLPLTGAATSASAAPDPGLPAGFTDTVVTTGLDVPTVVEQAPDGRIFVAEKAGRVKVLDGWDDPTPTVFADLTASVYDDGDRGLLGMALAPGFPKDPSVYVLYSHRTEAGSDGRLSRLTADGDASTGEELLLQGWCEQFTSHSIGALAFGRDGALYASGGDGASFNNVDVGDFGNPCQDPPTPGASLTGPDAQGGALRSQSLRRPAGPAVLNGTVVRLDPSTGDARAGNPLAGDDDPVARRVIAYGLRNPFRFALRPGTDELYVGDTGWNSREEVDRVADTGDAVVENFGWPCYEGTERQGDYDSRDVASCETLYARGAAAVTAPFVTKPHSGSGCAGNNSMSGVAFAPARGGPYPAAYDGALFYADYSRNCISVVLAGGDGAPDAATDRPFAAYADTPTSLATLPGGDLVYTSYSGTIHRITYSDADDRAPIASIAADRSSGAVPLEVAFDGSGSTDPEGGALAYSWDLDGDGTLGDATTAEATRTYTRAGPVTVTLRVTDRGGRSGTTTTVVRPGAVAPTLTIEAPAEATVGDTVTFGGAGADGAGAALPASALTWSLVTKHCRVDAPAQCHEHPDGLAVTGAGGSFEMPDHERIAHLELRLTATADGLTTTVSHRIDYRLATLTFASRPAGVELSVGGLAAAAPFERRERVNGVLSIGAPATATIGGRPYAFASWSDGGAAGHNVTVPAAGGTWTAVYRPVAGTVLLEDLFEDGDADGWTPSGSWSVCRPPGNSLEYCAGGTADVTSLAGDADWTDYAVEAAVNVPSGPGGATPDAGACVLARVRDASHYYQLELKPDADGNRKWWIWRRDGDAWTEIASGPLAYATDRYHHLRLTVRGDVLSAEVSTDYRATWTPLGSGTDATYATGRVGLRSWGAATTFDVVRVVAG